MSNVNAMRNVTPRRSSFKVTPYTLFGALFFVLGIVALIHPTFILPGKKNQVMVAGQKLVIETSRVVSIPRPASATEVVLGLGLIFFGSRKLVR
jgi:hypothetical protein